MSAQPDRSYLKPKRRSKIITSMPMTPFRQQRLFENSGTHSTPGMIERS